MLCPLAQFKNKIFEELIEEGLKKFENALNPSEEENYNGKISYENKQLAEAAIEKSLNLLIMEIHSLVEKKKEEESPSGKSKKKAKEPNKEKSVPAQPEKK